MASRMAVYGSGSSLHPISPNPTDVARLELLTNRIKNMHQTFSPKESSDAVARSSRAAGIWVYFMPTCDYAIL